MNRALPKKASEIIKNLLDSHYQELDNLMNDDENGKVKVSIAFEFDDVNIKYKMSFKKDYIDTAVEKIDDKQTEIDFKSQVVVKEISPISAGNLVECLGEKGIKKLPSEPDLIGRVQKTYKPGGMYELRFDTGTFRKDHSRTFNHEPKGNEYTAFVRDTVIAEADGKTLGEDA